MKEISIYLQIYVIITSQVSKGLEESTDWNSKIRRDIVTKWSSLQQT